MRCPRCGFDNPEGMRFCGACAAPLQQRCAQCGFENPPHFQFCGVQEVGLLRERWEQAQEGMGQVVIVSGEAGIGKSRLLQTLTAQVASEPHTRLACRGSLYSQNSALHAVRELVRRTLAIEQDDTPVTQREKLAADLAAYRFVRDDTVPLLTALLSIPLEDDAPPLTLSPQQQKQRTLDTLVAWLLEEATRLVEQAPTAHLLLLLTCRPEFQPPWAPRTHLTSLTLSRLRRPQVEAMITHVAGGKALPAEVMQQIVARADGVPLFVEELTKTVLEAEWLREEAEGYALTGPLPPLAIPATLQDALMARLDRLAEGKAVAQLGATLGRTFAYELLQAVAPLDELVLWRGLVQLVEAEVLYQRGVPPQATYTFKHALIQETAYQSLLKTSRQQYHQRIAQALAERFPESVETQSELLAHHYTAARLSDQAMRYWQQAGQRAVQHSAYAEAVSHFTKGLEVLATLPETPERRQRELDLQSHLGPALMVTKGWGAPEVQRTYDRARALCQHLGDSPQLVEVLRGLHVYYRNRAEYQTARELAEQHLSLAQRRDDPVERLHAYHMLALTLHFQGELTVARSYFEHALALYTAQPHPAQGISGEDYGVIARTRLAWVLWYLGYPDQALRQNREALALAQELAHPLSLATALMETALLHQLRQEACAAQEHAEAAIALATEQGFLSLETLSTAVHGWALAMQGHSTQGLVQMQQALAASRAMGSEGAQPYRLAHLAAAYGMVGQPEAGLQVLAEALATVRMTREEVYEPERYRLKGELLLQHAIPDAQQAETCFQQALTIARRQQARSLELRAAVSLSRLWQHQGKHAEAREVLAEVYGWFTEGFDTVDLQEAQALLATLEEGQA